MVVELACEDAGSGPPLLILHGLFGSASNWRSVARALAPRHRVLCVDLRNHGASPWADAMDYLEMAEDVRALAHARGLERPLVVGHSMGGKVAMALALAHPDRVGGLVVVDIAPVAYTDRLSAYVQAMRDVAVERLASRAEAQQQLARVLTDAGEVAFLLQNLVSRDGHFQWRLNLAAIGRAIPDLSSFPASLAGARHAGPTTLIHGTRSDYVTARHLESFKAQFPALQVVPIEGAAHWVHADRPAEFLAALQGAVDPGTGGRSDMH